MPFLDTFMKEVEAMFSQHDFWMTLNILDLRALPEQLDLLDMVWMSLTNSPLIMVMTNLIFTMVMNHVKKLN